MGLWDLVDEKKEKPQEKEEIKEAEVVKEETKETKKTLEKKSSTKKTEQTKKKRKVSTLEEQITSVPDNLKTQIDVIFKHLMTIPGMAEKMRNPNKTIIDMFKFISKKAKAQAVNGCAMIEDQVVFGWAVHYYDEENPK